MKGLLESLHTQFPSLDEGLINTLFADFGCDYDKTLSVLRGLAKEPDGRKSPRDMSTSAELDQYYLNLFASGTSEGDTNDTADDEADDDDDHDDGADEDDFVSDLAAALERAGDKFASADRSLLRASLAISESEYCDSDDENDEERDEHSVSTSAASPARGGTGAVGEKKDDDQHLLKELLDLIATQQTIIAGLNEENLALRTRVQELLSNGGARSVSTPGLDGAASRPSVVPYRARSTPAASSSEQAVVTSAAAPNGDDDDYRFVRDAFDQQLVSDALLRQFFAETRGDVTAVFDAVLAWLAAPDDESTSAVEALLATDERAAATANVDPYANDHDAFASMFGASPSSSSEPRGPQLIDKLRLDQLRQHFPTVDADALRALYESCGRNVERTGQQLRLSGFSSPAFPAPTPKPDKNALLPRGPTYRAPPAAASKRLQNVPRKKPRVQRAFTVVKRKRDAASAGAAERAGGHSRASFVNANQLASVTQSLYSTQTQCLRAAAAARQAGRHQDANAMLNKAKQLAAKRKDHLARFFSQQFSQSELRTTIDLHGQTVPEALQYFEETLDLCRAVRASRQDAPAHLRHHYLNVITGAGKHSPGGVARIRPAILARMSALGLKYRAINNGSFAIQL